MPTQADERSQFITAGEHKAACIALQNNPHTQRSDYLKSNTC